MQQAGGPPPSYEPAFLELGGVGLGSQTCHQRVTHTICCLTIGGPPLAGSLLAPELESDQAPALLGLKSLSGMRAKMDMDPVHLRLIVPDPGGIKVVTSPGTIVYPLEPTHSGHLLLPCSELTRESGEETIALLSEDQRGSAEAEVQAASSTGDGRAFPP